LLFSLVFVFMLSSFQGVIRGIYPLYNSGPRLKDCRGDDEVGIHAFAFSFDFLKPWTPA